MTLSRQVGAACWRSEYAKRFTITEKITEAFTNDSTFFSMEDAKNGKGIKLLVQVVSTRLSLSEAEWHIGYSKIFLRLELACKLEMLAKLQRLVAAHVMKNLDIRLLACKQAGCWLHG